MNHSKKIILTMTSTFLIGMTSCSFAATGKITGTGVRVREEANTKAKIITNLYKDDEVEVIEKQGEWYKIKYEGKEGYTHEDYIEVNEEIKQTNDNPIQQEEQKNDSENIENNQEKQDIEETKADEIVQKKIKEEAKIYILPVIYSTVTNKAEKDKVVTVNQVINQWSNISYDGVNGWIRNQYLENIQVTEPINNQNNTKRGYINVSSARVREKATTSSNIITNLSRNTEVTIEAEENGWYKVTVDGKSGYISKDLVSDTITTNRSQETPRTNVVEDNVEEKVEKKETETKPIDTQSNEAKETATVASTKNSTSGQAVVEYAKQFLGYRYVLGGASPSAGFDCSGFTYYVYKHFGVTLNRRASQQLYNGTKVEKSNLQVGDLIIFNDWDNAEPGHCGIYIGGNQFIHAANPSRGVVIDYMDSRNSYYNARYVQARRII